MDILRFLLPRNVGKVQGTKKHLPLLRFLHSRGAVPVLERHQIVPHAVNKEIHHV